MILYCILTSAINTLASLVLALAVYWKKPRGPANLAFCWFALTGAIWSGFYFAWQTAGEAGLALRYTQLLTAAAILIPAAYFHFATLLLGQPRRLEMRVGYGLALAFGVIALTTPWLVTTVEPRRMFPHWPVPGWLYPAYLLTFFYYFAITLWRLVEGFRAADGLRRNQLRLVTLGTAIGFAGGATNFLLWYNIPVLPVGNGLVAVYVVAVGYAIIRFRLMDFDLLAARGVAYTGLTTLLALLTPAIILALAHFSFIPPVEAGFWPLFFASFIATAATFWALSGVRRQIDAFLEQRVLGDRLADRELLRLLAARISSAQDETELFDQVVSGVHEALDVERVAIYIRTEFETDFTRRAATFGDTRGMEGFLEQSLLARSLRERQRSVLFDEVVHGTSGDLRNFFAELRRRQGIELAVPIIGDTYFYGFIVLGSRAGRALFNEVDISLLEAIGLQVGLSLRARQLERRTSQAEKLISLGTLAAGLAHELRNPLTSIQTFSALLKERGPDQDLMQEFGAVVQRDVGRIANIVENVAAFAESNKVEMTTVPVVDVLKTVAEIVRPELVRTDVALNLPANLAPSVRGNHSQLLQVFLNLVQNAVQALDGHADARITISFERRLDDAQSPLLSVLVADNGPGIDPALLPRIFEPFTTTKATGDRRGRHGMGLGLAIVKRIVQHHHGDIDVVSTVGRGTVFRVHLPLL
jgi:two-component system nitrogen regulation sensor histidine kinase GlnL